MTWKLSKKFSFEAAHCLTHLPQGHKCARPHGHSYVVEVIICSDTLDDRGFAGIDYGDLDPLGEYIKGDFDHQDLNVVMEGSHNTTAERLAQHFYKWCVNMLGLRFGSRPLVDCVRVYETAKTYAEYRE